MVAKNKAVFLDRDGVLVKCIIRDKKGYAPKNMKEFSLYRDISSPCLKLKKNKFLIVDNYDDLLFKTKSILERSGDFYQYYIERKSNYIKDYLTNQGIVGSQKKILEILEKYIKNIN